MSKFRNWALNKLNGRPEEEYQEVCQELDKNEKALHELKDKIKAMKIDTIRNKISIGRPDMLDVDSEVIKDYVKRTFSEELGQYMVEKGFASISAHKDGPDALVYTMEALVVKMNGGLPDESNRNYTPYR